MIELFGVCLVINCEFDFACGNLVVIGWKEKHSLAFGEVHVSDSSMDGSVFDFQGHHFE